MKCFCAAGRTVTLKSFHSRSFINNRTKSMSLTFCLWSPLVMAMLVGEDLLVAWSFCTAEVQSWYILDHLLLLISLWQRSILHRPWWASQTLVFLSVGRWFDNKHLLFWCQCFKPMWSISIWPLFYREPPPHSGSALLLIKAALKCWNDGFLWPLMHHTWPQRLEN